MRFLPLIAPLALVVAACSSVAGPEADSTSVEVTAAYRERIMLPPDAKVTITLADTSLADAPAKVVATQVIEGQSAPPFQFALAYDPTQIDARHTYSVSARIEAGGKLRFITDTHYPVITRGAPNHVEMLAVGVPQN